MNFHRGHPLKQFSDVRKPIVLDVQVNCRVGRGRCCPHEFHAMSTRMLVAETKVHSIKQISIAKHMTHVWYLFKYHLLVRQQFCLGPFPHLSYCLSFVQIEMRQTFIVHRIQIIVWTACDNILCISYDQVIIYLLSDFCTNRFCREDRRINKLNTCTSRVQTKGKMRGQQN